MRTINFEPEQLAEPHLKEWWKQWQVEARQATDRTIQAWEQWLAMNPRPKEFDCSFQQPVWKKLKAWLLEYVFHFKCAYCESPLDLDRYYGDAEHFRPKGQVTFKDGEGKKTRGRCLLPDGTAIDHPGYFWLAYHWRNLLPACSFCNTGQGKVDQFPLATSRCYMLLMSISELEKKRLEEEFKEELTEAPKNSGWYFPGPNMLDAQETPLLLNPLNPSPPRMPEKHLRYGLGGTVVAIDNSPLGENSIRVYNLQRDNLQRRRQKAQEAARRLYYATLMESVDNMKAKLKEALKPYRDGEEDYPSAALGYVREIESLQQAATAAALDDDNRMQPAQ